MGFVGFRPGSVSVVRVCSRGVVSVKGWLEVGGWRRRRKGDEVVSLWQVCKCAVLA